MVIENKIIKINNWHFNIGKRHTKQETSQNLEFQAVPKSQLSNKRALLCFMTSLSTTFNEFDNPHKEFPAIVWSSWLQELLYFLVAAINVFLAAIYKWWRICVDMPSLWSCSQNSEFSFPVISEVALLELPSSSFSLTNWDGCTNPISSLNSCNSRTERQSINYQILQDTNNTNFVLVFKEMLSP